MKFSNPRCLLKAHSAPCRKTTNEVWGLSLSDKDTDTFVTCGDDATLRVWSIKRHQQIKMVRTIMDAQMHEIAPDHRTNELQDCCRARCVAVDRDGEYIVVGFKDGTLRVYDKDLNQKQLTKNA